MIYVSLRHKDAASCEEIIKLVEAGLFSRQSSIAAAIAEHELISTNASSYEQVNLALEQAQKDNIQKISQIDIRIREINTEYLEWKKEPEPVLETSRRWAAKDAIKILIIAGVVIAALCMITVAGTCILSGILKNPADMKSRFGLRIIAQLPCERNKKPFAFVSRWFAKLFGIRTAPEDYDKLARMAGTSICSDLATKETNWKTIAFTGSLPADELQQVVEACGLKDKFTVLTAADILTDAASIEQLASADCAVLVEKQESSALTDIEKELEALKAWNKPVLGVIITNTDAIM